MMKISEFMPAKQYRYYYQQLSHKDKNVYNKILSGLLEHNNSIDCSGYSVERINDIFNMIKYDIPELFYIKAVKVQYACSYIRCTILPEYRFNYHECVNILLAMENKYRDFIKRVQTLDDVEKEKEIHGLIVSIVEYKNSDAPYSHEAPGTLLYGIGVCEGISKAVKYLSDRVGLESIVVTGVSNANDGIEEGHAWNLIKINGVFYHLDVTFDATITDNITRFDYFNLSDEEIKTNHLWIDKFPECNRKFDFYTKNRQFFTGKNDLLQYLKIESKKSRTIVFQLPFFTTSKERIIDAIKITVEEALSDCGLYSVQYYLQYNFDRMIFQLKL